MRSHIPKDGCQAPVTLRYSDHKSQCCIANLAQTDCFFPVLRTLTWRSTFLASTGRALTALQPRTTVTVSGKMTIIMMNDAHIPSLS